MKLVCAVLFVLFGMAAVSAQDAKGSLELRVAALEDRVSALEKFHSAPDERPPEDAQAGIVSVRLTRKEATRESPMLDFHNLVFDVEFTGTQLLGERRIRDIKGTLYFDDAFGDEIIGATLTKRLNIGAGDSKKITGLMIDYTTVELSDEWQRVLTTSMAELNVRFVVDRVIYEEK